MAALGQVAASDKMAVIVQEIVGNTRGERAAGAEVEIEVALRTADDRNDRTRLGLLQVRPMHVSNGWEARPPDSFVRDPPRA